MAIHPTAIVESTAEIDPTAEIGPLCVIGPQATIGPETRLISHVVVQNDATLGARNIVHPFASIGGNPQDLKWKGEAASLTVGDDNVIRECVTLNIGTAGGQMVTRIGNHCLFMAGSHLAHDCTVGDHVVLANGVGIAGHVELGNHVTCGGLSGVHQFCRVGRYAFLAGGCMVAQEVPPFCIAQGDRAQLVGINVIGLKRAGWTRERIHVVREAFKQLFMSGPTRLVALEQTESSLAGENPDVKELCDFIRSAKRGVCPPRLSMPAADTTDDD